MNFINHGIQLNIKEINMLLKEFYDGLTELIEKNPKALEYEVISSTDDEGNRYNSIYYSPSIGIYYEYDSYFISEDSIEEEDISEINSICIN